MMSRNKPRLYLALYARSRDPESYHYAIHVSPKQENHNLEIQESVKYHVKNTIHSENGMVSAPWTYERELINANSDPRLLVRVLVGKVPSLSAFEMYIEDVSVPQDEPGFNCMEWVHEALDSLRRNGIASTPHWDKVQRTALEYVMLKKKEGRFERGWHGDASKTASYDMILKEEINP